MQHTGICCIKGEIDDKTEKVQCFCLECSGGDCKIESGRDCAACRVWCAKISCANKFMGCGDDDLIKVRCCCVHVEVDEHISSCQVCCVRGACCGDGQGKGGPPAAVVMER